MALKTQPTKVSATVFLDAIADGQRRRDSKRLASMMARATGAKPVMWGSGIVGFGAYHHRADA